VYGDPSGLSSRTCRSVRGEPSVSMTWKSRPVSALASSPGLAMVAEAATNQAAQDLRHVGSEDPAVGVQLVDHDGAQAFEEGAPRRVARQDSEVQHVGRGDENAGWRFADPPPARRGRVSIVDLHRRRSRSAFESRDILLEALALVPFERFQRKQIEGPEVGVGQRALEDREVVHERLSAGRGRRKDHVVPRGDVFERAALVGVQGADAAAFEERHHRVESGR
jgi:hypothetical protein